MTALRVTEPSGSNGAVQFNTNGDLDASANFVFATGSNSLFVTGTSYFTQGISGSLTRLTDGTSYLIAGDNVTITSASNGSITISAAAGGGGGGGDPNATFVVMSATGSLNNERVLTAGDGVSIVDGGSGNPVTVSVDGTVVREQYWFSDTAGEIFTTGSVQVGSLGTTNEFRVNGMNLTPYSGSVQVPGSTLTDTVILDLSGTFSDNQYASFNIDILGTSVGITNILSASMGKYLFSVSMTKAGGDFKMVGVTELDSHRYRGEGALDIPEQWFLDVDASGSLYVNTAGTTNTTSWGAVVTKQTVMDINLGDLLG